MLSNIFYNKCLLINTSQLEVKSYIKCQARSKDMKQEEQGRVALNSREDFSRNHEGYCAGSLGLNNNLQLCKEEKDEYMY